MKKIQAKKTEKKFDNAAAVKAVADALRAHLRYETRSTARNLQRVIEESGATPLDIRAATAKVADKESNDDGYDGWLDSQEVELLVRGAHVL